MIQNPRFYQKILKPYTKSNGVTAFIQLITTLGIFLGLLVGSHFLFYRYGWNINILISIFTGFTMARVFIIQHDCSHGSFFSQGKYNDLIGTILSYITHIPFKAWGASHDFHHRHSSNMKFSNVGDMKTLSVGEYNQLSRKKQIIYRIFRNPVVLFGFGPLVYLLLHQRFPVLGRKSFQCMGENADREYRKIRKTLPSLFITDALLISGYICGYYFFGWGFVINQIIVMWSFGLIALWFFYVQHQFEDVYKVVPGEKWDYIKAALYGSSYYNLPKFWQWVTGNIGYHYLHHLNEKIPNYELKNCHNENTRFFAEHIKVLNFRKSLRSLWLRFYDSNQGKMITWKEYKNKKNVPLEI